ncbi:hypothetical protein [Galbibacter sp. PAP.153]|uniref:hypothetical protein n=1 Tax=Galbibacter sp. PAP.153 TaxID=3104623 RepID=UPI0030089B32
MLLGILTISCNFQNKDNSEKKQNTETNTATIKPAEQIKPTDICMFYNVILDAPSEFPVDIDGKIYYGCCDYSSSQLREDSTTRFSIDPFSGEKVDKIDALIYPDPNIDNGVLYFKSKENYLQFIEKLNE